MSPATLLYNWLRRQLPTTATEWLDGQAKIVSGTPTDRELNLAISLVSRKLGKDPLQLDPSDLEQAARARKNWDPTGWTLDQAGRIYLLLCCNVTAERFRAWLDQLCQTADVGELVAFYRGLPLYPDAAQHRLRAAEGIRSNMKAVFEAVAHRNPYPVEELAEGPWNQMVLKTLFVGSTLHPIQDLETRANPALMRMLCDYAHERWAAGRPISPELWRCVGRHADPAALADLERVLNTGTAAEREAAALALGDSPEMAAQAILQRHPDLAAAVAGGKITWTTVVQPH
ncbi:MAG: EboA domain-containing protein [Betaproteobacteria bacterium]